MNMSLLEKMKDRALVGVFSKTSDSAMVEAAGLAGLDFIILDQEHGPVGLETLHHHVRAAQLTNMAPLIRVKGVDAVAIGGALDTGAAGVQVPNINTAEQAKAAVDAARFYPIGKRGVCRFVRAAAYGGQERSEYFSKANQTLLVLQVEGVDGIANLDDILNVAGFDVLFVGPYDLSQSVGLPGQIKAPEVLGLVREIAHKAKARGIALGVFCDELEDVVALVELGFDYVAYSVDVNIYMNACMRIKGVLV
jgi:4-hydroxy-2-oxoheptanedioate aldolase